MLRSASLSWMEWNRQRLSVRRLLVIDDEVVGNRRSPDVERVLGRMVGRGPFHVDGYEVDAVRELRPATPRVLRVIEIVRAQDVPPDAPAFGVALRLHLFRPQSDLLESSHIPA